MIKTISDIIQIARPRKVLAIGNTVPEWLPLLDGEYVHIGTLSQFAGFAGTKMSFHRAHSTVESLAAIRQLANAPGEHAYDIIFIDHRHDIRSVLAQFKMLQCVATKETLFLFDDAIPLSIEMAQEVPSAGWWVGQVWMMTSLLQPEHGGILEAVEIGPTGLLVAQGCRLRNDIECEKLIVELTHIATLKDLVSTLGVKGDTASYYAIHAAASSLRHSTAIRIDPSEEDGSIPASRVVLDEELKREQVQPRFVVDLSGYDLDLSLLKRSNDTTPGKYLDTFENAYVLSGSEFVAGNKCLFKNIRHNKTAVQRMLAGQFNTPKQAGFEESDGTLWINKAYLDGAAVLPEGCFMGTPDEIGNWGMWVLYGIPAITHYLENRTCYSKLVIPTHHVWQRALANVLGVTDNEIFTQDLQRPYAAPHTTTTRYTFRNLSVPASDRDIFIRIRDAALATGQNAGFSEKIFVSRISRSKANVYRKLVNEERLAERLNELGYKTVEPELLSFFDQVRLFANAKTIVGLGGAGLFNAVFCKEQTNVITIESTPNFIGSHANIFATMGLNYGLVIGREDRSHSSAEHRPWSIDVDSVYNLVRSL